MHYTNTGVPTCKARKKKLKWKKKWQRQHPASHRVCIVYVCVERTTGLTRLTTTENDFVMMMCANDFNVVRVCRHALAPINYFAFRYMFALERNVLSLLAS